jgi:hypothetical protein
MSRQKQTRPTRRWKSQSRPSAGLQNPRDRVRLVGDSRLVSSTCSTGFARASHGLTGCVRELINLSTRSANTSVPVLESGKSSIRSPAVTRREDVRGKRVDSLGTKSVRPDGVDGLLDDVGTLVKATGGVTLVGNVGGVDDAEGDQRQEENVEVAEHGERIRGCRESVQLDSPGYRQAGL